MKRNLFAMLGVVAILGLAPKAYATPIGMLTSDFTSLFGAGALVPGATGSVDMVGTGTPNINGTVDYAVWDRTADSKLVFVYDIHIHSTSSDVDELKITNPFNFSTVDFSGLGFSSDAMTLTDGVSTTTGMGYVLTVSGVADTGVAPTFAVAPGIITDYKWDFITGATRLLTAGSDSMRVFAVFDAPSVEFAVGELVDSIPAGSGLVPVPAPEPASLILMGSGLAGLALWGRKKKIADEG